MGNPLTPANPIAQTAGTSASPGPQQGSQVLFVGAKEEATHKPKAIATAFRQVENWAKNIFAGVLTTLGIFITDNSNRGIVIQESGAGQVFFGSKTGGEYHASSGGIALTDNSTGGIVAKETGPGQVSMQSTSGGATIATTGGVGITDTSANAIVIQESGTGGISLRGGSGGLFCGATGGITLTDSSATNGIVIQELSGAGGIELLSGGGGSSITMDTGGGTAGIIMDAATNQQFIIRSHGSGTLTIQSDAGGIFINATGASGQLKLTAGNAVFLGVLTSDKIGFYGVNASARQTVTGAKGGNAALGSLLSALNNIGLIVDSSGP